MTASGRPGGGPFGAGAGGAMSRGVVLIGIAVLLGLFLLWQGLDDGSGTTGSVPSVDGGGDTGGSDGSDGDDDGSDQSDGGDATDAADSGEDVAPTSTTLFPTVNTRAPNTVRVLVANGSGVGGAAGRVSEQLLPIGYATLDPANANPTETSRVYYRPGYVDDAAAITQILGAATDTIVAFPTDGGLAVPEEAMERVENANVIVIIGSDGLVPIPAG